jgi:cytochrome c-type protein NapC
MNEPNSAETKPSRAGSWLWRRPRTWLLLGIPLGGFLAFAVGIAFSGGFEASLHYASSLKFCSSACHEMDTAYQEYTTSTHFKNEFGVAATCADCHVPPAFIPGLIRHMKASIEVFQHLRGKLATPADYEAHRLELAQNVWSELKSNDSAECRSCHDYTAMDFDKQGHSAAKKHDAANLTKSGETCIDCHKGIVHKLPPDAS